MKFEYKSPVITVEELTKSDVLCESQITPIEPPRPLNENNAFNFGEFM